MTSSEDAPNSFLFSISSHKIQLYILASSIAKSENKESQHSDDGGRVLEIKPCRQIFFHYTDEGTWGSGGEVTGPGPPAWVVAEHTERQFDRAFMFSNSLWGG